MLKRIVPRKVRKKAQLVRVLKMLHEPKCAVMVINRPLPAKVIGLAKAKFVVMATVRGRKVHRATVNVGQKCAVRMHLGPINRALKVLAKVIVLVKAMFVGLQ